MQNASLHMPSLAQSFLQPMPTQLILSHGLENLQGLHLIKHPCKVQHIIATTEVNITSAKRSVNVIHRPNVRKY